MEQLSTPLAPLLAHPDDDGQLTPARCAAMLPCLEAIIGQRQHDDGNDPVLRRRMDDTRQLVTVMQFCVDKDVELIFG